ncbi:uncharacterized protein LOC130786444 [Actinidia eriantha]|uniref:uncharacterized protein LOC130786444 n=1 Tax=Actinidia eriantha TaxID=165200 RepID=UPI0025874687|nr:uncharacterized protein LOC130786444 [Actinidia eriantha]
MKSKAWCPISIGPNLLKWALARHPLLAFGPESLFDRNGRSVSKEKLLSLLALSTILCEIRLLNCGIEKTLVIVVFSTDEIVVRIGTRNSPSASSISNLIRERFHWNLKIEHKQNLENENTQGERIPRNGSTTKTLENMVQGLLIWKSTSSMKPRKYTPAQTPTTESTD